MKYEPIKKYSNEEITHILENGTNDDLKLLSMSVGEYSADWKFAQGICLRLLQTDNSEIRANAILGLSYIARVHRMLDRKIVEPFIEKEIKTNRDYHERVQYAAEDIYLFMNW